MLSFDYSRPTTTSLNLNDLKRKYPNLMKIAEENQNSVYEAIRQLNQLSLTENLEVSVDRRTPKRVIPVVEAYYVYNYIEEKGAELGINIEEYMNEYESELIQIVPATCKEDMEYVKEHATSIEELALIPESKLEVFCKTIKVASDFIMKKLNMPRLNVIIKYV